MRKAHAALLFLLYGIAFSCQDFDQFGERITEGVTFEISTDLLANPLILQFTDPRTGEVPDDLLVTLLESDFSGVYTLDGRRSLEATNGILPLGVLKDELRGISAPRRILIRYEAPGYVTRDQVFMVESQEPRVVQVPLQEGTDPGPDVDELRTELAMSHPVGRDLVSNSGLIELRIPKQVRFLNAREEIVTGSDIIRANLYANSRANRSFLRKQLTHQSFRLQDGQLTTMSIEPIALITLTLERNAATDLLYPIRVQVPVRSGSNNRFTGEPLKAGDLVPVYGYDHSHTCWGSTGLARIERGDEGLVASTWIRKLQPLAIGWGSFQEADIDTECILLLDVEAEVSEPYNGVYRRDYLDTIQTATGQDTIIRIKEEVFFEYEEKPRLSFAAMFPNCATGNAQGLDGLIRKAKKDIVDYFRRQDSSAFKGVTFRTEKGLYPIFRPSVCMNQSATAEQRYFDLTINSDAMADGFLNYTYGNIEGQEYIQLEKGKNELVLPFPDDLFLLDGEEARFTFTFLENCYRLQDGTETSLCELAEGFSFDISPPIPKQPLSFSVRAETACNNLNNSKVVIRPTMPILFREHCGDAPTPYRYLGRLIDGNFEGAVPLEQGKSYDFLLPLGQSTNAFSDIQLSTSEAVYKRNGQSILLTNNNGMIHLDLGIIEVPDAICQLLSS
jgi:hypothetical protein